MEAPLEKIDSIKLMKIIHTDQGQQTLAQGEINGKWYFGKALGNKGAIYSVLLDNGKCLIDRSMLLTKEERKKLLKEDKFKLYAQNEIKKYGFNARDSLNTKDNHMSEEFISFFNKNKDPDNKIKNKKNKLSDKQIYNHLLDKAYNVTYLTLGWGEIPNKNEQNLPELMKKIQDYYMDLSNQELTKLTTHYTLATYIYEIANSIGYLFFHSDYETGKTKWANIIKNMGFNSFNASNSTPSYLFRNVEATKGLMFLDDYDKIDEKLKPVSDQILKVGYKKGGYAGRVETINNRFVPVNFDVYSPKMITNTQGLDYITLSRCITLHLLKTKTDKGKRDVIDSDLFWQRIRDCCYMWAFNNWKDVKKIYHDLDVEKIKGLNNRDLERIKIVLAVAKLNDKQDYETILSLSQEIFDDSAIKDFSTDWGYLMYREILTDLTLDVEGLNSGTNENEIRANYTSGQILKKMMDKGIFNTNDKIKPSVIWVGNQLSKTGLFKKLKRSSEGNRYEISLARIKQYMESMGWPTLTEEELNEKIKEYDKKRKEERARKKEGYK